MDVPTLDFVRVCSLAELRAKGRIVLHGRHSPILVVYDGGTRLRPRQPLPAYGLSA